MAPAPQTPSQTVGPFFGVGLSRPSQPQNVLADDLTEGLRIRIEGMVFDGAGQPVPDALIEIWQANAHGRYRHGLDAGPAPLDPHFSGFGRCPTDSSGVFRFESAKPGAIRDSDGRVHAPHVNVTVFARGMLVHAFTRLYFGDEALDGDPVLALVDAARRQTLVATPAGDGHRPATYRWDIHLQGDQETVFFDA